MWIFWIFREENPEYFNCFRIYFIDCQEINSVDAVIVCKFLLFKGTLNTSDNLKTKRKHESPIIQLFGEAKSEGTSHPISFIRYFSSRFLFVWNYYWIEDEYSLNVLISSWTEMMFSFWLSNSYFTWLVFCSRVLIATIISVMVLRVSS